MFGGERFFFKGNDERVNILIINGGRGFSFYFLNKINVVLLFEQIPSIHFLNKLRQYPQKKETCDAVHNRIFREWSSRS